MAKRERALSSFHEEASTLLQEEWAVVEAIDDLNGAREEGLSELLHELVTSGGSTYPFMLLTQLLGKATNGDLNAQCIQDSSELDGAWDARSLAAKVVTSWNNDVGSPFPGSNADPYVNNPARYKNFGSEMESKAGNKKHYGLLAEIVGLAQAGGATEARRLLRLTLIEARRFLESEKRDYFGPPRVSAEDVARIVEHFISEKSNGVRLQIIVYALQLALAEAFAEVGIVSSASTNAADLASGRTGDIECRLGEVIRLAIEVKDRQLTVNDLRLTALKARRNGVDNVLFVVQPTGSALIDDLGAAQELMRREFSRGIDLNFAPAMHYVWHTLLQLTPEQRAALLRKVHDALHEQGAHYKHVQAWMKLLTEI